jgi:hypothetical protein
METNAKNFTGVAEYVNIKLIPLSITGDSPLRDIITGDFPLPLAGKFGGFDVGEKGIVNKAFGHLRQMGFLAAVLKVLEFYPVIPFVIIRFNAYLFTEQKHDVFFDRRPGAVNLKGVIMKGEAAAAASAVVRFAVVFGRKHGVKVEARRNGVVRHLEKVTLALWTAKSGPMAWLRLYCNSTGFSNARRVRESGLFLLCERRFHEPLIRGFQDFIITLEDFRAGFSFADKLLVGDEEVS